MGETSSPPLSFGSLSSGGFPWYTTRVMGRRDGMHGNNDKEKRLGCFDDLDKSGFFYHYKCHVLVRAPGSKKGICADGE